MKVSSNVALSFYNKGACYIPYWAYDREIVLQYLPDTTTPVSAGLLDSQDPIVRTVRQATSGTGGSPATLFTGQAGLDQRSCTYKRLSIIVKRDISIKRD